MNPIFKILTAGLFAVLVPSPANATTVNLTRRRQFPPGTALASSSQLIMTLLAAAVRHAIMQDAKEAARILTPFNRMLPKNLAALEM